MKKPVHELKIRPLGDRVVVKTQEAESKSPGGLIIPETAKSKSQRGEVLAVGPGSWVEGKEERRPVDVEVGQVILYAKYGGHEVKFKTEPYVILREDEIIGVVEG